MNARRFMSRIGDFLPYALSTGPCSVVRTLHSAAGRPASPWGNRSAEPNEPFRRAARPITTVLADPSRRFSDSVSASRRLGLAVCRRFRPRVKARESLASLPPPQTQDVRQSAIATPSHPGQSEEHTSELQSQSNLVCRLLLEKTTYDDT